MRGRRYGAKSHQQLSCRLRGYEYLNIQCVNPANSQPVDGFFRRVAQ